MTSVPDRTNLDPTDRKTATEPTVAAPSHPQDRHFDVENLRDDLKGRSIRGGAVTLTAQAGKFALQLTQTVVLARLLRPADFGLIAMVTAVTGMVAMFKDAGLSMATVQREHVNHAQVSTLFWVNVALSVVLMAIVVALAPALVWLYDEPRLLWITLAVAGTFIFAGLSIQHGAILKRQMRFTALAAVDLTAMGGAVAVAIAMAWSGAGYWALVGMLATQPIVRLIMVWLISGWTPGLPRRGAGVRPMLAFGGNLTGFNFINYFARSADNILIGWYWGAGPLGLYTKAYSLLTLPLGQINGPVSGVAIPALSRLKTEPLRYRRYYFGIINAIAWATMPLIGVLVGTAESVILLVLGDQWVEAATIFRILGIAAFLQPVYNTIGWIFTSQGRADRMFRWSLLATPLYLLGFSAGLPFGIRGVAIGYATVFILGILSWTFHYTFQGTPLTVSDLVKAVRLPLLVGLLMAATTYSSDQLFTTFAPTYRFLMTSLCAAVVSATVVGLVPAIRGELRKVVHHLKSLRKTDYGRAQGKVEHS